MNEYPIIRLIDRPELLEQAAVWFHEKWGISLELYRECMQEAIDGDPVQAWYLCMDGDRIIAGMGEMENDFHDRPDLTPNIVAVYTEPEYRGQGIAGRLLNFVVEDNRRRGFSPVYLLTDHTGFYERYGWEYLCPAQGDYDDEPSRMYIHY